MTYLVLPVAPPWWAGHPCATDAVCTPYADGIMHLRDTGYAGLAHLFGIGDNYIYSYNLYSISSNDFAAFPSLHAAFPFLAFLFARRSFPRGAWLMVPYTLCVWFAIVYLGEHWVVDIVGGVVYAFGAYFAIVHGPKWARRLMDKAADEELEAGVEAENEGDVGALRRLGRRVRWALVGQGLIVAAIGGAFVLLMGKGHILGGSETLLYLVPWLAFLGGLWRAAVGLVSR